MLKRDIQPTLEKAAKKYPVVTITGPRQSGKTTLAREVFADKPYANLEAPDIRQYAIDDPRGFLSQYPNGAILDEIQRTPTLLSYIQTIVDEEKQNGQYILTGSHQLSLHQAISQSLAGRTSLLNLLPLSLHELQQNKLSFSLDQQILTGFYPRLYHDQLDPTDTYRNYFHTYVEKDIRELINIKNLIHFEKFIRLCAGRIGGILDMSSLANDVGVSIPTISHWLSILEASYLIFRLQPYYENFGKRMIKSPKLYFTDVGLACYLLRIENALQLARDPLRGNLFENMIVMDLVKQRYNQGKDANIYFYRDNHKNEVDVVIKSASQFIPIEIKSSQTFHSDFLKGLKLFESLVNPHMNSGFLIYAGKQKMKIGMFDVINYLQLEKVWGEVKI